jgi:hypothetical protein
VPESGSPTEPLPSGGTARLFGVPPAADTLVEAPKPDTASDE